MPLHSSLLLFLLLLPLHCSAMDWRVILPQDAAAPPASGRLLVLVEPYTGQEKARLATHAVYPGTVWVAAQDIENVAAGSTVSVDTSRVAWPQPFAQLPPGEYMDQAYLDRDRLYNLDQGGSGDLHSAVRKVSLPQADDMVLALDQQFPAVGLWEFPNAPAPVLAAREALRPRLVEVELPSALLSAFHDSQSSMRAWVLLPKDYDAAAAKTWPVAYMIGTFSATHKGNIETAAMLDGFDISNSPSMIWVLLDFWTDKGPSLFVDSASSGPWGRALVEEFIPALEARFRMDARPTGRLLTGHSSGGWSAAWLLTHYPAFFGGAWATSPDPLDFSSFLQTDLYAPAANLYMDESGRLRGVAREQGQVVTTIRDTAQLETVLGPQGGIFQSWDQVFSPPAANGSPRPLFDRDTGAVDAITAAYWGEHYDLSFRIRSHWQELQADLDGKLHVIVGTEDDHYLEDGVYLLRETMDAVGGRAHFRFLEGRSHNNLFAIGDDPVGLFREIAREMQAVARP